MKKAVKRVIRDASGKPQVITVDAETMQPISNMNGYQLTDSNIMSLEEMGLSPTQSNPKTTPGSNNRSVAENVIQQNFNPPNGSSENGSIGGQGMSRDVTNNFGYVDKPGIMGFMGMVPGPVGMAGKAVNAGINANNVAAANAARGMLGLDPFGLVDTAKGIAKDQHGKVADVSIGKTNYAVGLEPETSTGRTTLTPNEARSRANHMGVQVKELTPEEVDDIEDAWGKSEYGKSSGLFSGLQAAAKGVVDAIFGDDPNPTQSFPEAPQAPDQGFTSPDYSGQPNYSGQNQGYNSPGEGAGHFGGTGLGTPGENAIGGTEAAGLW